MKIPFIAVALFLSTVFGGLFGTAQSQAQPAFPQGPGPQHRAVSHGGVNYFAVVPDAPRDDIMDTTGHGLLYYRRIMRQGTTPTGRRMGAGRVTTSKSNKCNHIRFVTRVGSRHQAINDGLEPDG